MGKGQQQDGKSGESPTPQEQPECGPDKDQERARHVRELLNQGARLLSYHRPGEAAIALEQAYALQPDDVAVAINLGGAYVMQGRFSKAVPVLEAAAEREPDNPMVWTNLAAAYLGRLELSSLQMQDKAIAAFERALLADPQAPNVNYNLGLIYHARGDLKRASAHFWRALEVDPSDRDARLWLDRIQRAGQPDAQDEDASAGEPDGPNDRSN